MTWIIIAGLRGAFTPAYFTPVEIVGLVLALCRSGLDLLIPAALSDQQEARWRLSDETRTEEHIAPESHIVPVEPLRRHLGHADGAVPGSPFLRPRSILGIFNIVVALLIATIKGTLVVLFFMHLRYSTKLTMVTVVAAIFFS